jgi:hypothetical protein
MVDLMNGLQQHIRRFRLRHINRSWTGVALVAVLLVGGGWLVRYGLVRAAGTATLSLSPASSSVTIGSNTTFDVIVNVTGGATNAIQLDLDYPTGLFDTGSVSCGTDFPTQASPSVGSGIISIGCGVTGSGVSGVHTVAHVSLHSISAGSPGAPNVTFRVNGSSETVVVDPTGGAGGTPADILSGTTGGTYSVTGTDTTAPTATVTGPSDGSTVGGTVGLSATASDGVGVAGVTFRVDGADVGTEDTSSPYTFAWDSTSVSDGSHTIGARARDTSNNTGNATVVNVTVDNTAPNTSITSSAIGSTSSTTANFTFSSPDGTATFECRLDSGSYSACTSPKNYSSLTIGAHSFFVRAKDPVGNVDATPATENWTIVDGAAPSVPGAPSTTSPTSNPRPTWTWTASTDNVGVDHYEVQWCTDSSFTGCGGNVASTNLATYTHTADLTVNTWYFRVRALDLATNASAYTTAVTVDVQRAALAITNLVVTPSPTGAAVTWTTNFNGDSQVQYGMGVSGGAFAGTTTLADTGGGVTSHTVNLPTLVSCATFHLKALTTDVFSRAIQSTDTQFATTGCPGGATVSGAQSTAITAASGGSVAYSDADGLVGLTVPAGASASDLNYQVQRLSAAGLSPATAPDGTKAVDDRVYQFHALQNIATDVTSFTQPITVTMSYTVAAGSAYKPNTLKLYRRDTGAWQELTGCNVDTTARTVSCTTTQFSSYAMFGEQAPLAQAADAVASLLPDTGASALGWLLSLAGAGTAMAVAQRRRPQIETNDASDR